MLNAIARARQRRCRRAVPGPTAYEQTIVACRWVAMLNSEDTVGHRKPGHEASALRRFQGTGAGQMTRGGEVGDVWKTPVITGYGTAETPGYEVAQSHASVKSLPANAST